MSRVNNTSAKKVVPFCKVCYDSGKCEEVFSSHFIRASPDPNSKVVCPTLLNQACLKCGMKGHTRSRCTVRIVEKSNHVEMKSAVVKVSIKSKANPFDALDSDNESENECKPVKSKKIKKSKSKTMACEPVNTYATALLRTMLAQPPKKVAAPAPAPVPPVPFRIKMSNRSWADSDSEDDE